MRGVWSQSGDEDGPGAELLRAAELAERLSCRRAAEAGAALSRPPALAIDDEARARADTMIAAMVSAAESALRTAEPRLDAAPEHDIAARLIAARLLERSGLAAAALARADEHRIAQALRRGAELPAGDAPALDPIGGALVAESYAVHAAEAARRDRAGEPTLPLAELPAEHRHALFWHVAAALADAALALQGDARAGNEDHHHRAAAAAVARALAAIDDGDGIAPAAMRLAHALGQAGRLDDAVLAGTLADGRVAVTAALLAVRVGIGFEDARAMLLAPGRAALLLRAADVAPDVRVAVLLALAGATDRGTGPDPAELVAALAEAADRLPIERARAQVRRARLEPSYREALVALTDLGR